MRSNEGQNKASGAGWILTRSEIMPADGNAPAKHSKPTDKSRLPTLPRSCQSLSSCDCDYQTIQSVKSLLALSRSIGVRPTMTMRQGHDVSTWCLE